MFDSHVARTPLARARAGSGKTQAKAAASLGLSRGTLNVYESGKVAPSPRKAWEILAGLALGTRSRSEQRPLLLVSFSLVGQRFLSVGATLLAFEELEPAAWFADELEG